MFEIREILRLWLHGEGFRSIERLTMTIPKAVHRCVEAAIAAGVDRAGGEEQLGDEVVAAVCERVCPRIGPEGGARHGRRWPLTTTN